MIKNYDPKKIDSSQIWRSKVYIVRPKDDNEKSESEDSGYVNKFNRRFAKTDDELRQDILNLFKKKSKWTMDEIKQQMKDQPVKPVEQQVKMLCKDITGTSGKNAKYELRDTFK